MLFSGSENRNCWWIIYRSISGTIWFRCFWLKKFTSLWLNLLRKWEGQWYYFYLLHRLFCGKIWNENVWILKGSSQTQVPEPPVMCRGLYEAVKYMAHLPGSSVFLEALGVGWDQVFKSKTQLDVLWNTIWNLDEF